MLTPFAREVLEHWNRTAAGPRRGHRYRDLGAVAPELDALEGSVVAVRANRLTVGISLRERRARWSRRPTDPLTATQAVESAAAALEAMPAPGAGERLAIGPVTSASCTRCSSGRRECPPTVQCPRNVTVSRRQRIVCPTCHAIARRRACPRCVAGQAPCTACGGAGRVGENQCRACVGGRIGCPLCGGDGSLEAPCGTCKDAGSVERDERVEEPCPTCGGSGARECPRCKGAGSVSCERCGGEGQFAVWQAGRITYRVETAGMELVPLGPLAPGPIPPGAIFSKSRARATLLRTGDELETALGVLRRDESGEPALRRLAGLRATLGLIGAGATPAVVILGLERVPIEIASVLGRLPDEGDLELYGWRVTGAPAGPIGTAARRGRPPVSPAARRAQDLRDRRAAFTAIALTLLLVVGGIGAALVEPLAAAAILGASALVALGWLAALAMGRTRARAQEPLLAVLVGLRLLVGAGAPEHDVASSEPPAPPLPADEPFVLEAEPGDEEPESPDAPGVELPPLAPAPDLPPDEFEPDDEPFAPTPSPTAPSPAWRKVSLPPEPSPLDLPAPDDERQRR